MLERFVGLKQSAIKVAFSVSTSGRINFRTSTILLIWSFDLLDGAPIFLPIDPVKLYYAMIRSGAPVVIVDPLFDTAI